MARPNIIISESDMNVLKTLVSPRTAGHDTTWRHDPNVRELAQEIARAKVVRDDKVPADVVRLGCKVHVREAGSKKKATAYVIVLPHEASFEDGKVSVMSPIGAGLLGYRTGDSVTWPVPGGERTWTIDRVEAPEASYTAANAEEAA